MKHHHIIIYSLLALVLVAGMTSCRHGRDDAMLGRLDYVSRCNRSDTVFTERWLPTVDSLVSYFDRHGSANQRMMAHYVRGRVLHDMGEAPAALECYQTAADQADTTRTDCDLYTLYAVYGQMADLFDGQYLPDEEMQALKMAERIAWKDSDTLTALSTYELRARPYYLQKDTDSVLLVKQIVRNGYLALGRKDKAARSLRVPFSIYLDRHQYQKAYGAMTEFEKESGWFDDKGNIKQGKELYYYDRGRYELAVGSLETARTYFERTLTAGKREAGYKGLLAYYEKKNIADSISKYARLFAAANDSGYYHVERSHLKQISSMYNYSRQQKIAEKRSREADRWMACAVGTVLATMLIISAILIVFFRFKVRQLQKISFLRDKKDLLEQLLRDKESSAIESKKEIVRLNNKNSSNSKQYNESIKRLKAQVENLHKELLNTKRKADTDPDAERTIINFKQKLQEYHKGVQPPTESEWRQLKEAFSCQHLSGYQLITSSPTMTEEQLRICLMTVLDISESMMAFALGTDRKRVDRVKRQANKKLFSEDNASMLKSNLRPYFE